MDRFNVGRVLLVCLLAAMNRSAPATGGLEYYPDSTVKCFQLTGDWDRPRGVLTPTLTETVAGVSATDLGSSFEHKGKLYFLFGDTWGRPGARDVLGWAESVSPHGMTLNFHCDEDGLFLPMTVPGVALGDYEVPSYGISIDDRMYVVFTTDHSDSRTMGRSVMTVSDDDGRTFQALHDLSTQHFINVAMATARQEEYPELPAEECVLIWGTGEYRASSPHLACIPMGQMGQSRALRYYSYTPQTGRMMWVASEDQATELFDHPVMGEFSVAWIPQLSSWIMLYNSSEPQGIVMRSAGTPWGPWSDPIVIFAPWRDMGYSQFMHVSWNYAQMDTFHDDGREYVWGGEYGPYVIGRFTQGTRERCTIFYTLSTWNPYQVVLMSSDIGDPNLWSPHADTVIVTLPNDPGWRTEGYISGRFSRNDVPHVTTWGPNGDADMCVAQCGFLVDANDGNLAFTIHGGGGEVVLIEDEYPTPRSIPDIPAFYDELKQGVFGPVVEAVAGPKNNALDIPVRWNLRRHAGKYLRLFIVDCLAEPWGFISVSEFALTKTRPQEPTD